MELLVTLLVGIAWPVATLWLAYMFRGELRALLARISRLKYKDLEANFEKGLAEAEAKAIEIGRTAPPLALPRPEISSRLEQLRRIADLSPRAAILEAWILVEDAAGRSGYAQGAAAPRVNVPLFVENLVRERKLPEGSITLVDQMRRLRNQAAHLGDFELSQEDADRYLQLASQISESILKSVEGS
jgi:hypothetical protein